MAQELLFLRDLADVEPPRDRYKAYEDEDIYKLVPKPQWTGLEDEIWTPRANEHDPQLEKVKALIKRNAGEDQILSPAMAALSGASAFCFLGRVLLPVSFALLHTLLECRSNHMHQATSTIPP